MESEEKIRAQVQRDLGSQTAEQTLVIKNVKGRDIKLKFVNNCFRKHFSLPSKKKVPTAALSKIEHKLDMRFMAGTGTKSGAEALKAKMQNPSFKWHGESLSQARKNILEKYTSRADTLDVIDLSSGTDAVMTEMALTLVDKSTGPDWKVGTSTLVTFKFIKDCVVHMDCVRNAVDAKQIDHAHKRGNTVNISVLRQADDIFVFDHIEA